MGSANPLFVGVSHDWDFLRTDDFGGAVPALAVFGLAVNFDVLRIVATVTKRGGDCRNVGAEAVGRDLEPLAGFRCVADAFDEGIGGLLISPSHREVDHQLVMAFNRHECVYIARALIVLLCGRFVAFLDRYVTPNFVELKIRNRDINQQTAHELFALLARRYQEPQNRVPMQAGKPLGRPDAVSFQEHPKCRESIVNRRGHLAEGLRLFFCGSPLAIDAAKAEATVAVYREPLARPLAGGAGHCGFDFRGLLHD